MVRDRFAIKFCLGGCGTPQYEHGFCDVCRLGLVDQSLQIKTSYPRMSPEMVNAEEELALEKDKKMEQLKQNKLVYDKLFDPSNLGKEKKTKI